MSRSPRPVWARLAWLASLALVPAALGCSAIVSPDPSRLGGVDAAGLDAGRDGGRIEAGTDTGMPDGGPDAPLECTSDGMCDDMIACTANQCQDNTCAFEPNDSLCGDGERCSAELGCVPLLCTSDASCADGDACNGDERCLPGDPGADPDTGCVDGVAPDCDDRISCTADDCNAGSGCVHVPDHGDCDDGIACTFDVCSATAGPTGCENRPDDTLCGDVCTLSTCSVAMRGCTPGVRRTCDDGSSCTVDFCDVGLGGCSSDPLDADMDGAPALTGPDGSACAGGTDCDDTDPDVRPGATEVCNGVDDNCNMMVDEGCPTLPDDCASARPVPAVAGMPGVFRATGNFGALGADYDACSASGPDAVYYVDVAARSDLRIDTMGSVETDTILGVGVTCDETAFAAACNDDQDPGPSGSSVLTSRVWLHSVTPPPGSTVRVYILVKAFPGGGSRDYTLNVTVRAAIPDSCTEPLDITGGGLVVGSITPSTTGLGFRGSCDPDPTSSAAEAVFRLLGPGDGQIFNLTARSASFSPILYTRGPGTSSCMGGPQTGCSTGGVLTAVPAMSGRTQYVFVDGASRSSVASPYTLSYDP